MSPNKAAKEVASYKGSTCAWFACGFLASVYSYVRVPLQYQCCKSWELAQWIRDEECLTNLPKFNMHEHQWHNSCSTDSCDSTKANWFKIRQFKASLYKHAEENLNHLAKPRRLDDEYSKDLYLITICFLIEQLQFSATKFQIVCLSTLYTP